MYIFWEPISFEEYQGMKTAEIAEMVKSRIAADIEEHIRNKSRLRRAG